MAVGPLTAGPYTATHTLGEVVTTAFFAVVTPGAPLFQVDEQQEETATPGETFHYQIKASGTPTFSLLQAPAGMTINATTGQVSWLPTTPESANFKVTVLAANGLGSNVYTFTVKLTSPHFTFLPLVVTR